MSTNWSALAMIDLHVRASFLCDQCFKSEVFLHGANFGWFTSGAHSLAWFEFELWCQDKIAGILDKYLVFFIRRIACNRNFTRKAQFVNSIYECFFGSLHSEILNDIYLWGDINIYFCIGRFWDILTDGFNFKCHIKLTDPWYILV